MLNSRDSGKKWFPYNKGGGFRRWYGINELVINWENDGAEIKDFPAAVIRNPRYYFKEGITFPRIGSNLFYARYSNPGFIFDCNGPSCFPKDDANYILGLLNSSVMLKLLKVLCPTLSFQIGDSFKVPYAEANQHTTIGEITSKNISISKQDWDAHETSWDFQENEIVRIFRDKGCHSVEEAVGEYKKFWTEQFDRLHANEEELNRQFIDIYGLQDELSPDVPLDEVTILQQGEISIEEG